MSAFKLDCSCGDSVKVDAASRNDAVSQMKNIMNADGIATHFKEKHPGQPVPPVAAVHQLIEQGVKAA
ncbi:MAG TPA: hypothetical protein VN930_09130 [Xanthobacteraceae bacterium]|jgi:hypothetical protein|nr:hypothetical protein [Xanthobacteraceae bacterium]